MSSASLSALSKVAELCPNSAAAFATDPTPANNSRQSMSRVTSSCGSHKTSAINFLRQRDQQACPRPSSHRRWTQDAGCKCHSLTRLRGHRRSCNLTGGEPRRRFVGATCFKVKVPGKSRALQKQNSSLQRASFCAPDLPDNLSPESSGP